MDPLKPGWLTSEFWLSVLHKLLAFILSAGLITQARAASLEAVISSTVALVFVVLSNWRVVASYTQSRTQLKSPPGGVRAAGLLVVLVTAVTTAGPVWAHAPAARCACPPACTCGCQAGAPCRSVPVRRTALLPWRRRAEQDHQRYEQRLQALENGARAAPTPQPSPAPQIIYLQPPPSPSGPAPQLTPPRQQIPLGGPPLQTIPLGGVPHQVIPIGGVPHVLIPLASPPGQQIPLGGPPKQPIDNGAKPDPALPPDDAGRAKPGPVMPKVQGPTHHHEYTRAYALYRNS
jgi:hypothetical protein